MCCFMPQSGIQQAKNPLLGLPIHWCDLRRSWYVHVCVFHHTISATHPQGMIVGTSPLYTFSGTFTSTPDREDVLGALSMIIWTLTLVVCVKYCGFVLSADDNGEGGTFALYSLLSRYVSAFTFTCMVQCITYLMPSFYIGQYHLEQSQRCKQSRLQPLPNRGHQECES